MGNVRTILFVDDDPRVLDLVAAFFEHSDLQVITAATGEEGLAVLEAGTPIDLLMTDIMMPGKMDGFEVAHRAKQLRPDLQVIYISGFVKEIPWGRSGVGYGPLLAKPFRLQELRGELERALGPAESAGP